MKAVNKDLFAKFRVLEALVMTALNQPARADNIATATEKDGKLRICFDTNVWVPVDGDGDKTDSVFVYKGDDREAIDELSSALNEAGIKSRETTPKGERKGPVLTITFNEKADGQKLENATAYFCAKLLDDNLKNTMDILRTQHGISEDIIKSAKSKIGLNP